MAKKKGVGGRGSEVKAPPKGSGGPPSAKAREDRAKSTREPPPAKYGVKKKAPKRPKLPKEWPILPDWEGMPWPPKGTWPPKGFEGKPPKRPPRKPKKPMAKPRKAKKAPAKRKK